MGAEILPETKKYPALMVFRPGIEELSCPAARLFWIGILREDTFPKSLLSNLLVSIVRVAMKVERFFRYQSFPLSMNVCRLSKFLQHTCFVSYRFLFSSGLVPRLQYAYAR